MKGSLLSNFAKYVSLNILGMIGLSCYFLADTYFIAKVLGANGLAALNISLPIYGVIQGIALMLGIGGATRFSILRSQDNDRKANLVFTSVIKLGIIVGVVFIVFGIFGAKHLAGFLGSDSLTLPLTKIYLGTIMIFAPSFILNNIILVFVRNDNNPNLAMIAMLVGSFSNIILDYIFMFPLKMGMFGAAFATGLSPLIGICVLSVHFFKKENTLSLIKEKLQIKLIFDVSALGLSAFITEISSGIVLFTFNLLILRIAGNIGVAAYAIVANLALVGVAIFTGLAQGTQPLFSRYYGLKRYDLVKKVYRYAIFTSIGITIVIYLFIFLYSKNIVRIFNSENNIDIAQIAEVGLKIYFIGLLFAGINIATAMFLSATENPKNAFFIALARGIIIIIPMVIILSRIFDMIGIWLAFVLTEFVVTVIAIYLIKIKKEITIYKLNP